MLPPLATTATLPSANGVTLPAPERALAVLSFGATHPGKERRSNEDQFVVATLMRALWVEHSSVPQPNVHYGDDRGHVFVVADGVGGSNAGERASALAVGAVEGFLLNALRWLLSLDGAADADALRDLQSAVRTADACVYAAATNDPGLAGMGTTLTLAYSLGSVLFVAHVGDSRCYLARAGTLYQLTRDDTVVQALLDKGLVSPGAAEKHSLRHMITNVVGGRTPGVQIEVHRLTVERGDVLLLCTDGLTNMVPSERIHAVLQATHDPQEACTELIRLANENGGTDNVTVIVAHYV